jgi:AraC-like DNA-binding protein/mannose-6-phosphate isomerase-like protein (cupin superfamily)
MKTNYSLKENKSNKLIYVGCFNLKPTWKMKKHSHTFHEMEIIIRGSTYVKTLKNDIYANPGDILFFRSGVTHKPQSNSNNPVESIVIQWERKGKTDLPVKSHDTNKKIRFLAQWLFEEKQSKSPYKSLLQKQIFGMILTELKNISVYKKENPIIGKIRNFMREHLKKQLTLEDLANYAGMSKYHFLKNHKKLTGLTPMDDLRTIRVKAAKDMIFTTDLSLKTISAEVGFANRQHFSRIFREHFGSPPGQFHKNSLSL